jgi:hypothetical protein
MHQYANEGWLPSAFRRVLLHQTDRLLVRVGHVREC